MRPRECFDLDGLRRLASRLRRRLRRDRFLPRRRGCRLPIGRRRRGRAAINDDDRALACDQLDAAAQLRESGSLLLDLFAQEIPPSSSILRLDSTRLAERVDQIADAYRLPGGEAGLSRRRVPEEKDKPPAARQQATQASPTRARCARRFCDTFDLPRAEGGVRRRQDANRGIGSGVQG